MAEIVDDDGEVWPPPSIGDEPWGFCMNKGSKFQTFFPLSPVPVNIKSYRKSIPQLRGNYLLPSSSCDWLILCNRAQCNLFALFNLVTLQTIILPPLSDGPDKINSVSGALISTPDRDDCVLVLFFNQAELLSSCQPALPNSCWVTQRLQLESEPTIVTRFAVLNGVIYGTARVGNPKVKKKFFYVKIDSNSLALLPLQIPEPDIFLIYTDAIYIEYLVESCNRLYRVYIFNGSFLLDLKFSDIKVFELDLNGKIWREVYSLDGRAFFLSSACSTWCWGTTNCPESQRSILGNSIYFSWLPESQGEARPLYLYNLHDQSLMALRSCPNLLRPVEPPVWMISQHQRLLSVKECKQGIEKVDFHHQGVDLIEHEDLELSEHNVRQESRFSELPLHLVELISKYMHLFEYWNFAATCKIFRSLCPAPQWRTNNVLPLFMYFKNNNGSCELVDPCRPDSRSTTLQLSPKPFVLQFSKNGWLLTLVGQKYLQFFNLFTGERGDYPPFVEDDIEFKCIGFSTYPTCSECLTVGMVVDVDDSVLIYYHHSRKGRWNDYYSDDENVRFRGCSSSPIYLAGAFYFLDLSGNLGAFQLVDEKPSWRQYDKPTSIKQFHSCNLVECEGKLYSVFIEEMGNWVQVFRFDDSMKNWVEVKYLENYCLFISRAASFSIVTRDPRMRNRIYFPKLLKKCVVFYSQDTKNYHVLDSNDPIEDLYGTFEPLRCCWI